MIYAFALIGSITVAVLAGPRLATILERPEVEGLSLARASVGAGMIVKVNIENRDDGGIRVWEGMIYLD